MFSGFEVTKRSDTGMQKVQLFLPKMMHCRDTLALHFALLPPGTVKALGDAECL